ncbi:MAG: FHA domain-containing protein [Candidatus Omnitrophota bacterium]
MKSKTLTIMFVDIQGFTFRTARQNREENELFIRETRAFVEKHLKNREGVLVKTLGDGFLATFESSTDAVICGIDIQKETEKRNANILNPDNLVRFRIGISTGEVSIDENGDVYGDAVNITSRLQKFCEPNEVFISESTYLAMNKSEIKSLDLGPQKLENGLPEIRVYKVLKDIKESSHATRKQPSRNEYVQIGYGDDKTRVRILKKDKIFKEFVFEKEQYSIGRDSSNDIALESSLVSRRHLQIERKEGCFWVRDLNSTNGTFINGSKITGPVKIKGNERIEAGEFLVQVELKKDETRVVELGPKRTSYLGLEFFPPLSLKKSFEATPGTPVTIGRIPECSLSISDSTVSKIHAQILRRDGDFFVEDLQSTNGTFLNGQRVDKSLICDGDILEFGKVKCRIILPGVIRKKKGRKKMVAIFTKMAAIFTIVVLFTDVISSGLVLRELVSFLKPEKPRGPDKEMQMAKRVPEAEPNLTQPVVSAKEPPQKKEKYTQRRNRVNNPQKSDSQSADRKIDELTQAEDKTAEEKAKETEDRESSKLYNDALGMWREGKCKNSDLLEIRNRLKEVIRLYPLNQKAPTLLTNVSDKIKEVEERQQKLYEAGCDVAELAPREAEKKWEEIIRDGIPETEYYEKAEKAQEKMKP